MKSSLRVSLPRTKREQENFPVDADPYVAAAILTDQRELEAIERGTFKGDIFDPERDWRDYSSPLDNDEFMRSIHPDWPEMSPEKEKR